MTVSLQLPNLAGLTTLKRLLWFKYHHGHSILHMMISFSKQFLFAIFITSTVFYINTLNMSLVWIQNYFSNVFVLEFDLILVLLSQYVRFIFLKNSLSRFIKTRTHTHIWFHLKIKYLFYILTDFLSYILYVLLESHSL